LEERLVAYYSLLAIRHLPNTYMGSEFHVIEEFQGKGIGTALYEYILLEDHYIVISNHVHTKYSSAMWDKLQTISSLKVGTYDEIADVIDWNTKPDKAKIYNNDHIHFIVSAR
jgi:GNAT superfamily N-acetyltransferase